MKRYFLPLLLATACVGVSPKGWAMEKPNKTLEAFQKNQAQYMMNLGGLLTEVARPSNLQPQYSLRRNNLDKALEYLEKKPVEKESPPLEWKKSFMEIFNGRNRKDETSEMEIFNGLNRKDQTDEEENLVQQAENYLQAPLDIRNPCFEFSEKEREIWQILITKNIEGFQKIHNQIAVDIEEDFKSLLSIDPTKFSKLEDVNIFIINQKTLLQGIHALYALREQISSFIKRISESEEVNFKSVEVAQRLESSKEKSQFLTPKEKLVKKYEMLEHNIISAFAKLFDFLGSDFSQPEWDDSRLSNWIEYCDEYLNAFNNLVVENAQKNDFSGYLKLLEIRTDMDLEKNLRNKDKINQQTWNLLIEDTLKSYNETQAWRKIIKLFRDEPPPLTKKTKSPFFNGLTNCPKEDSFISVSYRFLKNPSLQKETLKFLNQNMKTFPYLEEIYWDLFVEGFNEKDYFQKPVVKKGQQPKPSKFEKLLNLKKVQEDPPYANDKFFKIAFIWEQQKKTKEAVNLYEYLASKDYPEANLRLCIAKLNGLKLTTEQLTKTLTTLEKALAQTPDPEGAWVLSQGFFKIDKGDEGMPWLFKAMDLGHPQAIAYGNFLNQEMQKRKALQEPQSVLIIDPNQPKVTQDQRLEEHKEPEDDIPDSQTVIGDDQSEMEAQDGFGNIDDDGLSMAPSFANSTFTTGTQFSHFQKTASDLQKFSQKNPNANNVIVSEKHLKAFEKFQREKEEKEDLEQKRLAKLKEQLDSLAFKESQAKAQDLIKILRTTPKEMKRKDVWDVLKTLENLASQCGVVVELPTNNQVHKFSFKNTATGTFEEGELEEAKNLNPQEEGKEDKKPTNKKKKNKDKEITSTHTKHTKNFKTPDFDFKNRLADILQKVYRLD